ncbi:TPR-like protein [Polychaeton citri CBS 116435]|uniref:TPR-like protein n=1 Tax=Polychaeton citri CBS 116435 TaxID=1314669 RepID=A0A9P4Q413_9PEZI|nr:TPR-like protein [Polychaeton citri CBS 116435]
MSSQAYAHGGVGPLNVNNGSGRQLSNSINGANNSQYNADTMNWYNANVLPETQPETTVPRCLTPPLPRDPDFVERGELQDEIKHKLNRPAGRCALVGLGGSGKTQLVAEHCHRGREETSKASKPRQLFWIHASSEARFNHSISIIVERLKLAGRETPKANLYRLLEAWLDDPQNGHWLVVLDNVDDASFLKEPKPTHDSAVTRTLFDYFPSRSHGSLLITSRTERAARKLTFHDDEIVRVGPMLEEHAIKLLRRKLEDKNEDLSKLASALEYMPLALAQAAALIVHRRPFYSMTRYLERLGSSGPSILQYDSEGLIPESRAAESIVLTWQITFEHIRSVRPSAADLLSLMSCFDRNGIPILLLHKDEDEDEDEEEEERIYERMLDDTYRETISAEHSSSENENPVSGDFEEFELDMTMLRDFLMVKWSDSNTLEMHRLVQLSVRIWLGSRRELERWKVRFSNLLCAAFHEGPTSDHSNRWALFPHVMQALALRPKTAGALADWADLLYAAALIAEIQGRESEAKKLLSSSLRVWEDMLEARTGADVLAQSKATRIMRSLGNLVQAVESGTKLLGDSVRLHGKEHPYTIDSMDLLASTYFDLELYDKAEELMIHTLEIKKRAFETWGPGINKTVGYLASIYTKPGRHMRAEKLISEFIEAGKVSLGQEHIDMLEVSFHLGAFYHDQGRYEEAEKLHLHCLRSVEKHGPKLLTLSTLHQLVSQYIQEGRFEEAEKRSIQALEVSKGYSGVDYRYQMAFRFLLAMTFDLQGIHDRAQQSIQECIAISISTLGAEHPETRDQIQIMEELEEARSESLADIALRDPCNKPAGSSEGRNVEHNERQSSSDGVCALYKVSEKPKKRKRHDG